jgi:hypothetical protein
VGEVDPPTGLKQTASAQVEKLVFTLVMVTLPEVPKSYVPMEFQRPPFTVWFTLAVAVPAACAIVTGAAVGRLGQVVHQRRTSYFPAASFAW